MLMEECATIKVIISGLILLFKNGVPFVLAARVALDPPSILFCLLTILPVFILLGLTFCQIYVK